MLIHFSFIVKRVILLIQVMPKHVPGSNQYGMMVVKLFAQFEQRKSLT